MPTPTFCRLGGVWLPIQREEWKEKDGKVGDDVDASSGQVVGFTIAERAGFEAMTKAVSVEAARAIKGLVKGLGENWPMDATLGRLGSKGSGLQSGTITTSGGPITGLGKVSIPSNQSVVTSGGSLKAGRWQVECWRQETAAVDGVAGGINVGVDGWHHYVLQGTGIQGFGTPNGPGLTQWRDGVQGAWNAGYWFTMNTGGNAQLDGRSSANANTPKEYAQIIVRPYSLPAAWVPYLFDRTRAEAYLPDLWLEGDCVDYAMQVIGKMDTRERVAIQIQNGGGFGGGRVSFSLTQQPS